MKKLFPVIFCGCSSSPSIESVTISSDKSELDINETAHITIKVSPEDAQIYNLYINGDTDRFLLSSGGNTIDNFSGDLPILIPSLDVDLTAEIEGETEIYITADNVESNKLIFNIVDKEKEQEREKQRIANQEREKRQAEISQKKSEIAEAIREILQSNFTTENYLVSILGADENTNEFLPEIRFSHHFSDIAFSSKIVNDIIDALYMQDSFENIGETTISFETDYFTTVNCREIRIDPTTHTATYIDREENDVTSQILQAEADSSKPEESSELQPAVSAPEMVWISDNGSKYHDRASCSNMNSPYLVTVEEAEAMGRTPCKRCY